MTTPKQNLVTLWIMNTNFSNVGSHPSSFRYFSSGMLKCKLWQFSVAIFTFILCKILIICNLSNIYLAIETDCATMLPFFL